MAKAKNNNPRFNPASMSDAQGYRMMKNARVTPKKDQPRQLKILEVKDHGPLPKDAR